MAGTTVISCSVPWTTTCSGTCSGTATTLANAALLTLPNVTVTSNTPGGGGRACVYLQFAVAGVIAGITATVNAPAVRTAGDRTSS